MAFFARVSDDSIESVTLSINGASYSMDLIGPPDGYREVVDQDLLGSATTWRITAVDTNGLASTLERHEPLLVTLARPDRTGQR